MTMETKEVKVTKKMRFEELLSYLREDAQCPQEHLELIEEEIATLEKKSEYAKNARAKKKAEVDELTTKVFECLNSEEFTTIPQVVKALDEEEVTEAKVKSRLSKLVQEEKVEKELVTIGDRKLTGYRIIG